MTKKMLTIFTVFFVLLILGFDRQHTAASQPIICRSDGAIKLAYDPELRTINFKERDFEELVSITTRAHGEEEWLTGSFTNLSAITGFILKLPRYIKSRTQFTASLEIKLRYMPHRLVNLTCEIYEEDVSALAF